MEPEPKTRTIVMAPYWVSILSEMNEIHTIATFQAHKMEMFK